MSAKFLNIALITVLFFFSKCTLSDGLSSYEYIDNLTLKYQFPYSLESFQTESMSRGIEKCDIADCITIGETMLFKPRMSALSGLQETYDMGDVTVFVKPINFKIMSQEIDAFSITTIDSDGNSTFIFHPVKGIISFELQLKIVNYKTGEPFLSRHFLILSTDKGLFSKN